MANNSLETAADALMALIRANITGINVAPDKPPEKIAEFPFASAWPGRGRMAMTVAGEYKAIATIILEIHVARKNLPAAIGAVFPFEKDVGELLFDPDNIKLTNTVDTLLLSNNAPGVEWTFGSLSWAGIETVGWRFEIPLKQDRIVGT